MTIEFLLYTILCIAIGYIVRYADENRKKTENE